MLSFEKALEEGAGGIELDVRKTSDGEFIVIHDSTVDRTTDGEGVVSELSWDYISQLDAGSWKSSKFANRDDTKVPKLIDVLDTYKDEPVFLSIHLKVGMEDVLEIINLIEERDMLYQSIVFADRDIIGEIKELNPDVFVINDGINHEPNDLIDQAIDENWDAVSIGLSKITSDVVTRAQSEGLLVQVSYLSGDYESNTQDMIDLGVDFILGDAPKSIVSVLKSNKLEQLNP